MTFRRITEESIPCWYELSWCEKQGGIMIKIHRDFIKNSPHIANDSPYIENIKQDFGFKEFGNTFTNNFGFEKCFLFEGVRDGFHEFFAKLPVAKVFEDKLCSHCRGEKNESGWCLYCDGHGRPYHYDYQRAYAISATFTLFTQYSMYMEAGKETSASESQLLTVQTVTIKGPHGGSLNGYYGVHLSRLLGSLPQYTKITEMIGAMKKAWEIMNIEKFNPRDHFGMLGFEATVANDSGWLNVSCPGDACGLHPSHHYAEKGHGYEFSCHNTDTPVQQLTLLAGLAGLHDKARKEILHYSL